MLRRTGIVHAFKGKPKEPQSNLAGLFFVVVRNEKAEKVICPPWHMRFIPETKDRKKGHSKRNKWNEGGESVKGGKILRAFINHTPKWKDA